MDRKIKESYENRKAITRDSYRSCFNLEKNSDLENLIPMRIMESKQKNRIL